ncbi:MAG: DUF4390 domain-containing protein [Desulforhopalus sp.]
MRSNTLLFPLILLLALFIPAHADSGAKTTGQATINDLTATTSETHLIVFGTLENSFTSEMIEILHSGIPLRFSFFVELYKTTEKWPDELVVAYNFKHAMTFDTLKENYRVTLEEDNNKVLSFRSLFEAQKQINEINGARVVELKQLLPDNRYKLRMRAELYQKTLPLSLHNILPFLSWWDVETDWHTITFNY